MQIIWNIWASTQRNILKTHGKCKHIFISTFLKTMLNIRKLQTYFHIYIFQYNSADLVPDKISGIILLCSE